jgi:hypothetical protein
MKEAFQEYFKKLKEYADKEHGTLPIVPNFEEWDKSMLVGEEDEEGYIQWLPKEIDIDIDWESLEQSFGFSIKEELKEFYTSYLFIDLRGKIDEMHIDFEEIINVDIIPQLIEVAYKDGGYYVPDQQMFMLGGATLGGADDLVILYRNTDGKVICYDPDFEKQVELDRSLTEIIREMEPYR